MQGGDAETIVITGASSGIGRELAIQLSAPNRVIWLIGRDTARLEEVAARVREKDADARVAVLELTDLEACARFLEETFPAGQRVDSVYLCAAITLFGEVKDTLPGDWERLYQTNLLSPVQWVRHFYARMVERRSGKIIIVSSLAAYAGYPTATVYATMKAGLLGLFRSLRHEAEAHGVTIHLASPGYVDTTIYQKAVFRNTSYERTMEQIRSMGFKMLPARDAASIILRGVQRGDEEFAFPGYASAMKWVVPRMPFAITLVHGKILRQFRKAS